jgi:hypothetical protein
MQRDREWLMIFNQEILIYYEDILDMRIILIYYNLIYSCNLLLIKDQTTRRKFLGLANQAYLS